MIYLNLVSTNPNKTIRKDHERVLKLSFPVSSNYYPKVEDQTVYPLILLIMKKILYILYISNKNYSGNLDLLKDDERDHHICINSFNKFLRRRTKHR